MIRSLAFICALLVGSSFLAAQVSLSENCDLSVRVVNGEEHAIEGQVKVELFSTQGLIATASIIGGEQAQFRVANAKTYRVAVSGNGFEKVTTPFFEIHALEPLHIEIVHVKPDKSAENASTELSTISVSEMQTPKKARNEMNKGLDAYSSGDWAKATGHFEKALAEYPRYARAYDMLGVIAVRNSDRDKARELFSKATQADNTFLPAYLDLARMDVQDENYVEATSLLEKVMAANASMPDALALRATMEFARKEYDKALADVERTHALPHHENFAEVHAMAGKVLRMQNRPEAAIVQFQLFLLEKPDSPLADSIRQTLVSLGAKQSP